MKTEIDWDAVMKESERQEKLVGEVSKQIEQERSNPDCFADSKKIMEKVEKEIKKNNLNALEMTNKGSKK